MGVADALAAARAAVDHAEGLLDESGIDRRNSPPRRQPRGEAIRMEWRIPREVVDASPELCLIRRMVAQGRGPSAIHAGVRCRVGSNADGDLVLRPDPQGEQAYREGQVKAARGRDEG